MYLRRSLSDVHPLTSSSRSRPIQTVAPYLERPGVHKATLPEAWSSKEVDEPASDQCRTSALAASQNAGLEELEETTEY